MIPTQLARPGQFSDTIVVSYSSSLALTSSASPVPIMLRSSRRSHAICVLLFSAPLRNNDSRGMSRAGRRLLTKPCKSVLDRLPTQGARMILVSDRLADEHAKNPGSFRPAGL